MSCSGFPKKVIGDHAQLDFGSAFKDLRQAGVSPVPFDGVMRRIARPAVDLDRLRGDAFGHFGREQLDHGRLEVAANAGIDLSADRIHQLPCGLDVGRHLRQFEADRLKLAYRPTELNPFLRVFQRVFQAPPRQTYGACRGMRPCDLKATRCQIEGTTRLAYHVGVRNPALVEGKFPGLPAKISDFRDRSEEHTSELQSLMRISYAVFCLKKKK